MCMRVCGEVFVWVSLSLMPNQQCSRWQPCNGKNRNNHTSKLLKHTRVCVFQEFRCVVVWGCPLHIELPLTLPLSLPSPVLCVRWAFCGIAWTGCRSRASRGRRAWRPRVSTPPLWTAVRSPSNSGRRDTKHWPGKGCLYRQAERIYTGWGRHFWLCTIAYLFGTISLTNTYKMGTNLYYYYYNMYSSTNFEYNISFFAISLIQMLLFTVCCLYPTYSSTHFNRSVLFLVLCVL